MKQLLMVCDESILSLLLEYWIKVSHGELIYDANCVNCKERPKISASSAVTCCHRLMDLLPKLKFNSIKVNFKIFDTILSSKFKCILAIGQMTDANTDLKEQINDLLAEEIEFNEFIAWCQELASKLFFRHILLEEYSIRLHDILDDLCHCFHFKYIQPFLSEPTANKTMLLESEEQECHDNIIVILTNMAKTKELSRFKNKLMEFIQNDGIETVDCNLTFFCRLLNTLR